MANPFFDFLRSARCRFIVLPGFILALVVLQYLFTADVNRRTEQLRVSLNQTYSLALQLTRRIGYGGLIHDFKNHVLRPDEDPFLERARLSADEAITLLQALEASAAELGVSVTLAETRKMIEGYRSRLERVRPLVDSGLDIDQVDDAVRLDDRFAIQEIDEMLEVLAALVTSEVEKIVQRGSLLGILSLTASSLLAILVLTLMLQARNRSNYLSSIDRLNERLSHSNANLKSANTSLKQFAGIVSHDLKTPLRHINLFSEQILEDVEDPALVKQHTGNIHRAAQQMTGMISSLLDFTRTGYQEPDRQPVEINDLLHETVDSLEPLIKERRATVDIVGKGKVHADAPLLRRVIYNLIENSLKYVADGVEPLIRIKVETVSEGSTDHVRVCVSDNGIGIAPEFRERVFEPMLRLHSGQSPYKGDGIGLSLAKTVINAHGGDIRAIDGDDDETGACICFTLPCDEPFDEVQGA